MNSKFVSVFYKPLKSYQTNMWSIYKRSFKENKQVIVIKYDNELEV